jgi:3-oxoacyl-[acyl-carrier protein] reductase
VSKPDPCGARTDNRPSRVLVTGSTRGIGWAIAWTLAHRGMVPILTYRADAVTAEQAMARLSTVCAETQLIHADVCRESDLDRMFQAAFSRGPIDVLVNNVGEFLYRPFLETTRDDWERILHSNLLATAGACRRVLPSMRARGRGHIINVTSLHADRIRARPNTLPYAIAKMGVVQITHSLAKTEAVYGIRVNAVAPGFIDGGTHTQPEDVQRVPLGRLGTPEDIAQAVAYLVSPEAEYVTGAVLEIHGGALL